MQDPNEDTQWNDALRARGIIPEKEVEVTEDDLVGLVESSIHQKTHGKELSNMTAEELDEHEDSVDEEEERMFEQYRRQRLAEMKATKIKEKYGEVTEITKADYVREVNEAGDGIYVVLHVYKQGFPLCSLLNQHLSNLAKKFPATKFLRSISSLCIPNYPDKHLPTVFIYKDAQLLQQLIGPAAFGATTLTIDRLELLLSQSGAVHTELEPETKQEIRDVMNSAVRDSCITNVDDDGNDW